MKLLFTLFIAFLFLNPIFSQDIIKKLNGDEIKGKVIEVTNYEIKYKIPETEEIKAVPSIEVEEIIFKNGEKKSINNKKSMPDSTRVLGCHKIDWDALLLAWGYLCFDYEYINKKNTLGILIPLAAQTDFQYYTTGIDFRFYLNKMELNKMYIGPAMIGFGDILYFVGPGFQYHYDKSVSLSYSSLWLKAGAIMQLNKGLNLSAYTGAGALYTYSTKKASFDWTFNLSIGWRFHRSK